MVCGSGNESRAEVWAVSWFSSCVFMMILLLFLSQHHAMIVICVNWFDSFSLGNDQFIQRVEVGLRAGNHDVGISTMSAEDALVHLFALRVHRVQAVLTLDADRYFAERVNP